jgi:hypothetical protein
MTKYYKKRSFICKMMCLGIFCTRLLSTEGIAGGDMQPNASEMFNAGITGIKSLIKVFVNNQRIQQETEANFKPIEGARVFVQVDENIDLESQKRLPVRVVFPNGNERIGELGEVLNPCSPLSLLERLLNGEPEAIIYVAAGLSSLALTAIYTFG